MPLKKQFITHLLKTHPTLSPEQLDSIIAPQLLSPFEVRLPTKALVQAQDFITACFELRQHPCYLKFMAPEIEQRGLRDPGNKSMMMSYDFHVDSSGVLKLIEINTNASFLALGYEMYQMRELPLPNPSFSIEEIGQDIRTEVQLQGKQITGKLKTAIIDEEPETQRLFIEFLVYQSYFQQWGCDCVIADYRNLPQVDFIYNRFTDFYLERAESKELKEKFLDRSLCLSPNPFEYLLLADKQRMIDWCRDDLWQGIPSSSQLRARISRHLPLARDLNPAVADDVWSERKNFFLKPKRAFGSKQSFRGGSISRKAFEEILEQDFIAQEFVPAPEMRFQTPEGEQDFKFDLRFYAYQDRLQMVVARLYQGQVTNLRTPWGGFAPVLFH